MFLVRYLVRVPLLIILLLIGLFMAFYAKLFLNNHQVLMLATWWHRRLLNILSVRVNLVGELELKHGVMVSNHISWLDIVVIGACFPTHFVSKAEVKSWPLVGRLATAAGTLFIERGNNESANQIKDTMKQVIEDESFILFFPEATTTNGVGVKKFHPRLFGAAIESGEHVQPVAIKYESETLPHPFIPFIDDQSFGANLYRVLGEAGANVTVKVGQSLSSANKQRKQLSEESRDVITSLLGLAPSLEKDRQA